MKNLILIPFMILWICGFSQNAGFNCEGLPDNWNPTTEAYVKQFSAPHVMRAPSGAGVKFMHLDEFIAGANRDSLQIVKTFDTLEVDENEQGAIEARESILNEWRKDKLKVKSDLVVFADAALANNSPVIWVLNVFNGTADESIKQLDYLFARGVNVIGVEPGNESYAWYSNTFEWYEGAIKPHINAVHAKYPQLKISLVSGHMDRGDHNEWNEKLALYIRDHNAEYGYQFRATVHTYLRCTVDETKYNLIAGQLNAALNTKMLANWNCMLSSTMLVDEANRAKVKYQVPIWVTEWNSKPYEPVVNSLVNGAWMLKQFFELTAVCEYVTNHNGISSYLAGDISKAAKMDISGFSHFRRTGFFSLQLYLKYPNAKKWVAGTTADGTYYYWNITGNPVIVANSTVECVDGDYPYSSAGHTGYMGTGSTKQYEIDGIKTFTNILPAYSYGIVTIGTPCVQLTFYADTDGDFYGDIDNVAYGCVLQPGYVFNNTDCDDQDGTTYPGAFDDCNDFDDNCNGIVDENWPSIKLWADNDGDTFGAGAELEFCAVIPGFVENSSDCNDEDAAINMNATEVCGNGIDENCDRFDLVCPPPPVETCLKKRVFYIFNKKCVETTDLDKCTCPK